MTSCASLAVRASVRPTPLPWIATESDDDLRPAGEGNDPSSGRAACSEPLGGPSPATSDHPVNYERKDRSSPLRADRLSHKCPRGVPTTRERSLTPIGPRRAVLRDIERNRAHGLESLTPISTATTITRWPATRATRWPTTWLRVSEVDRHAAESSYCDGQRRRDAPSVVEGDVEWASPRWPATVEGHEHDVVGDAFRTTATVR